MRISLFKWYIKFEVEVNLYFIIFEMLEIGCDWFWYCIMFVYFVDLSYIFVDDKFFEFGVKVYYGCF